VFDALSSGLGVQGSVSGVSGSGLSEGLDDSTANEVQGLGYLGEDEDAARRGLESVEVALHRVLRQYIYISI